MAKHLFPKATRLTLLFAALWLLPLLATADELSCDRVFAMLTAGKELTAEQMKEIDRAVLQDFQDLFQIEAPSRAASDAWNARLAQALESLPAPKVGPGEKAVLSADELDDLGYQVRTNQAIRDSCSDKYEKTPGVTYGFCFGRAVGVHLLARNMGLANDSIRKVWMVGTMHGGTVTWGHHVATAVRTEAGWRVIDGALDSRGRTMSQWFYEWQFMAKGNPLMMFATQADRFGPSHPEPLFPVTAAPEAYHGFFHDLFRSARKEGEDLESQIRSLSARSAAEEAAEAAPKPKRKRKPRAKPAATPAPESAPAAEAP